MILWQPLTYILLELHIILISLIIYKPSTLIIFPRILACNWELAHHCFVCSSVQFPFAPFRQLLCAVFVSLTSVTPYKGNQSRTLQEISQLNYTLWNMLQPTSRRFLRELDEASGGNNLHYILQCLHVLALVTRVWTRKVCWVATECSWNDGSETQYYVVILDWLQGRSRGLERVPELCVRGSLTLLERIIYNIYTTVSLRPCIW